MNYLFLPSGTILDLYFALDDPSDSPFEEEPYEDVCVRSYYRVVYIVENSHFLGVGDCEVIVHAYKLGILNDVNHTIIRSNTGIFVWLLLER